MLSQPATAIMHAARELNPFTLSEQLTGTSAWASYYDLPALLTLIRAHPQGATGTRMRA